MNKNWRTVGFIICGLILVYAISSLAYGMYSSGKIGSVDCFTNPTCVARNVARSLFR